MAEHPETDDDATPPSFTPAPPVDFRPDDPGHRLEPPGGFRPDPPGHRLPPPTDPVAAAEPGGLPGGPPAGLFGRDPSPRGRNGAGGEEPSLWGGSGPPPDRLDDDPGGGSWVPVTVVLMVVFIAVAIGFTALTEPGADDDLEPSLDGARLDRVEDLGPGSGSSAPTTTATTAAPPTTAPATTQAPAPARWEPFAAPDGAFRATLPAPVREVPSGRPGVREYRAEADGVAYVIRAEPFVVTGPEAAGAAVAAASEVLPAGTSPVGPPPAAFPGNVWAYEFRSAGGPSTVVGQVLLVGGRRFVLGATVETAKSQDPAFLEALVRFRGGFVPAGLVPGA